MTRPVSPMDRTVAALYVARGGAYWDIDGVDPWDEQRDARLYAGPWPVIAHPPCARWCRLAGLVEALHGIKKGEDDGCFEAALGSVRKWGGVLEHPAYSDAWAVFSLPVPLRGGGWQRGICGGWSAYVEQIQYGHQVRKSTWLYAVGVELPSLAWGYGAVSDVKWSNDGNPDDGRRHMPKSKRKATPEAFRDLLIDMARSVYSQREAA